MNFKWTKDIYDDNYDVDDEEFESMIQITLPQFCRPIGLGITFAAIVYKIAQLSYPAFFTDNLAIPGGIIFFFIMLGLVVEALVASKNESLQSVELRKFITVMTMGFFIVGHIGDIWHWLF